MKRLQRYALKRATCEAMESEHPWIFRDKIGEAANDLEDGDWLQLVDPVGATVGTGIYQAEGGVAVRIFRHGHKPVTVDWLKRQLQVAIDKRTPLFRETDAYRVLNGESDGFPGIVLDVYAGVGVLQTYVPGVDALGRYLAGLVADRMSLSALIWKAPSKRVGGKKEFRNRLLRGERPYVVRFHEGPLELAADLFSGQKSGTYLDLRGLRRFLAQQHLRGKRVLNLFAYTGAAGLACAQAGATEVVNVDQAQPSLEFGQRYHKGAAQRWECADVFTWINELKSREYDWIVVDPPSMASNKTQVLKALKTYHRLYSTLLTKLKPGGTIVACCCTSRISLREFEDKVSYALRPMSRKVSLPAEIDHAPAFAEADYLKVLVFHDEDDKLSRPAPKDEESKPPKRDAAAKPKPYRPSKEGAAKSYRPSKKGAAKSYRPSPEGAAKPYRPSKEGAAKPYRPFKEGAAKPNRPFKEDEAKPNRPFKERAVRSDRPFKEGASKPYRPHKAGGPTSKWSGKKKRR